MKGAATGRLLERNVQLDAARSKVNTTSSRAAVLCARARAARRGTAQAGEEEAASARTGWRRQRPAPRPRRTCRVFIYATNPQRGCAARVTPVARECSAAWVSAAGRIDAGEGDVPVRLDTALSCVRACSKARAGADGGGRVYGGGGAEVRPGGRSGRWAALDLNKFLPTARRRTGPCCATRRKSSTCRTTRMSFRPTRPSPTSPLPVRLKPLAYHIQLLVVPTPKTRSIDMESNSRICVG